MRKSLIRSTRFVLQGRGVGLFGALGRGTLNDQYCFEEINLYNKEPIAISAGLSHTAVITSDNRVAIFGRPFDIKSVFRVYGIYRVIPSLARWVTNFTMRDQETAKEVIVYPTFLDELMNQKVVSVSCSGGLTMMLTDTGKVYCIGANNFGQCGFDASKLRLWKPIANVSLPPIKSIDTGLQHCIALCENGEVYCWGKGKNGQIGIGESNLINPNPRLVQLNKRCVAIASGLNHSVALDESGVLHIWGKRMSDEVVEGNKYTFKDQLQPRAISLPDNLQITSVACSTFTTVVTASDGTLWMMGLDEMKSAVTITFQKVLKPFTYNPERDLTEEELSQQVEAQEPYQLSKGDVIKKGYYSVALISSSRQQVYDVALKNGVARLHEIGLDFRKKGNIKDFSMGFRHCLVITEVDSEDDEDIEEGEEGKAEEGRGIERGGEERSKI